jgi:hypothetical protein
MRRGLFATVVALLAVFALVSPEIAGAHEFSQKPRVKISKFPKGSVDPGDRVVVAGDIKGKRLCRARRVVSLYEVTPGSDNLLDTDRSDRDGEYRFVLRPDEDMRVYAKIDRLVERRYGHRHRCRRSSSDRLSINVG